MSAIDQLFENLRSSGRKALCPFVTAGDPDLAFTGHLLTELVRRGSSLCELGIPYSDPIADGPVIQASYARALSRGFQLRDALEMLGELSGHLSAPVVTMVSHAIVYRRGLKKYVTDAQRSGVAGLIVPDLPLDEAEQLCDICSDTDMSLIQLITPTTPRDRARRIAKTSSGFIYYVSVTGITGERDILPADLIESVSWLRGQTELPICVGFGISSPEHVKMLSQVADGLIVGSAVVRRVAKAVEKPRQQVLDEVGDFIGDLVASMDR